jgi:hypothetical protein
MEIPLKIDCEDKKGAKLDGVITMPSQGGGEDSQVAVLLLHGAGGDMHGGHMGECVREATRTSLPYLSLPLATRSSL